MLISEDIRILIRSGNIFLLRKEMDAAAYAHNTYAYSFSCTTIYTVFGRMKPECGAVLELG